MLATHKVLASAITTLFRFQIAILAALMGIQSRKIVIRGAVVKDVRANNNQ
jgi:hypothetical protein